jgi:hypothetical protein
MTKEYYLQVNGDGSLNRGSLSLLEGDKDITLIESIKQPTEKGWESKKKIYEDVEVIYKESDYEWIITEESAMMLVEKYGNVTIKSYYVGGYTPPSATHAIADFITKNGTDPYDIG